MSLPGTRRLNPRKLLLSKWTAAQPRNRERHFLVTELLRDEEDNILGVELQAVLTRRSQQLDWRQLQDTERWLQGWR
ncbi:TIGR02450 family Trp-rich protein [Pseudomonas sp. SH1-B]